MHKTTKFSLLGLFATLVGMPAAAAQETTTVDPALDVMWVFTAAVLVFLMQGGFALLGAGAIRSKSTINYLMKSVMDFGMGALIFFVVGYAFMFGSGNAFIGLDGFALGSSAPDGDTLLFFLFQVMFAATAATIVAGAVAERMKLGAYVLYTVAITAIIYPIFGHWMWGGGFLAELGAVDFAGSAVVHGVGGLLAFVAAALLGPRLGRFRADGKPSPILGHNQVYVVLGTLLLFFGWFGFNTGSTLSAHDALVPLIAVNTFLAGCAGATAVFVLQLFRGPQDIGRVCNGLLSGLVAITAPCAFVAPWAAILIGGIGGVLYVIGAFVLAAFLKVDDPVGAAPVHGLNGIFGLMAVGIFADGTGGVSGLIVGNTEQFVSQLIAAGALLGWTLGTGLILFKLIDVTVGLRISKDEELQGLDEAHHGGSAYPEQVVSTAATTRRVPIKKVTPRKGSAAMGTFQK